MAKRLLCAPWKALLQNTTNRGQIYNDFLVNRRALTQHLNSCQQCKDLFIELKPRSDIIPNSSMTNQEFAKAIRELWKLAREKNQTP